MTEKDSSLIKLLVLEEKDEKLDKLAAKYGSTGEAFYDTYQMCINEGTDAINHIGYINTAFDNATDKEKSTVVELLAEIHKIRTQKTETERVMKCVGDSIALVYDGTDFGTLQLETVYKGVSVTITYQGEILILKSKKRFDFYLQDRTRDAIFKHIKDKLEVADYIKFLERTIPEIEAVLNEQRERKTDTQDLEEAEETVVYSDEVETKATALVEDPAIFYKLGADLEKGFYLPGVNRIRYILGEESLKRQLAVHMIASRWGHDTINILSGGFATVKDTLVKMIFHLTGTHYMQRGYLTAAGMRYSKDMHAASVLYMPEAEISGEKGRQMRLLRTDDAGFEFEYAFKNPETGKMETETGKVNAKTIVVTTNDLAFDPALTSGGWVFNTDDSKPLTEKVICAKLEDFTTARDVLSTEDIAAWHCALNTLTNTLEIPKKITIPYAANLGVLFNADLSQSRRSPEKLCELIQDVVILRRYQKPGAERPIADAIDLFYALRIGATAITETIAESSAKETEICDVVNMLDEYHEGVSAREIAMKAPYASNTCYALAEALTTKGYLAKGKRGRENVYSIKNELGKGSKLCLTLSQSLEHPISVLKACLSIVYPFFHLLNSDGICEVYISQQEKDTFLGLSNIKIIDPLKGSYIYVSNISSELKSYKISELDEPGGKELDSCTFKVFIRDDQSLEEEDRPTEEGAPKKEKETGKKTQKDVGTSEDTQEENSDNVTQTTNIEEGDAEVRGRISKGEGIEYQKMGGGEQ